MLLKFRLINCPLLLTKWLAIWFRGNIEVLLYIGKNWRGIRKFILSAAHIFSVKSYVRIIRITCFFFMILCHFKNVINFISLCIIKILFYIVLVKVINLTHLFYNTWALVIWFNFNLFGIFNEGSVEKWKHFLTQSDDFFKDFMKKSDIFLILSIVWLDKKVTWKIKRKITWR